MGRPHRIAIPAWHFELGAHCRRPAHGRGSHSLQGMRSARLSWGRERPKCARGGARAGEGTLHQDLLGTLEGHAA